ncbi:MAG: hypothetical protein WHS65_03935 [Melioribacteraceae bacterium]
MEENILKSFLSNLFESDIDINQIILQSKEFGRKYREWFYAQKENQLQSYLSIIVPFTNENHLLNLMKSFEKNVSNHNSDLIIVANKNQVPLSITKVLKDEKNILIELPENINHVVGCEIAANLSLGNDIVFLNYYLEIKPKWLEFLRNISLSKMVDAITFKILDEEDKIEEAGYSYLKNNSVLSNGKGAYSNDPEFNYVFEVPTSSIHALFIKRNVWEKYGFDNNLSDFSLAIYDLGKQVKSNGGKILYQPLSTLQVQNHQQKQFMPDSSNQSQIEIIDSKRPAIINDEYISKIVEAEKKNILIVGIYLGDRLNNVEDIISTLQKTKVHNVKQKWVAINQISNNHIVRNFTVKLINKFVPKFEILNNLLGENISYYDYIIVVDDDIILPNNFLDRFIGLQSKYDFALAQPARTKNSYIDHPIVQQQDGVIARQTLFVEIGPVFSIHKSIFNLILPFDLTSPMGWGYENIWAKKISDAGKKMGIIDAISVDHSLRKPVENYDWSIADNQRNKILNKYSHFSLTDCFKVIDIKTVD